MSLTIARQVFACTALLLTTVAYAQERVPGQVPNPTKEPAVVTPGATPGAPPSDAIVLFDGKDLSKWVDAKGAAFCALSDRVWDTPELNFAEFRSAAAHRAMLEAAIRDLDQRIAKLTL